MSKGLGRIERQILSLLRDTPGGNTSALALAVEIFAINPDPPAHLEYYRNWYYEGRFELYRHSLVTDSQHSTVRRALASLKRKGLIVGTTDRHYDRSRRYWALIENAQSLEYEPTDWAGVFSGLTNNQ